MLHSNVSLPPLSPSATPAPSSSFPRALRGWQPIRAARGPSWAPQAEQTARGFPAQRLLCPQPSSRPGSAFETARGTGGWAAATPGPGCTEPLPAFTSTFPPRVLLPLPSCSRRLEPWATRPERQRATGAPSAGVQTVSFTHTALSSSSTPLDVRWRGKGKRQKRKGMQTCLLQCWKIPARITGTSGLKGEF